MFTVVDPPPEPEKNKVIQFKNTLPLVDFGINTRIDENTAVELCTVRNLIHWNPVDFCYKVADYKDLSLIRDIIKLTEGHGI